MLRFFAIYVFFCVGCSDLQSTETSEQSQVAEKCSELAIVSGTITYRGTIPKHAERDDAGLRRDLISVNREDAGLAEVMVYLVSDVSKQSVLPPSAEISITQEDFEFRPGVIGVLVGQRVLFQNDDPENHNVRADAAEPKNALNVMTTQQNWYEKTFQLEPAGDPIRLSCDIHRWMDGWVYVFEDALFSVTNEHGEFSITNIPAGDYALVVEQPSGQLSARVQVHIEPGGAYVASCIFEQSHLYGRAVSHVEFGP